MIQTRGVELAACGQQARPGSFVIENVREGSCILLMSAVRSIIRMDNRLYYMQPFTFLLHPVALKQFCMETQGTTAYRYLLLRFSQEYSRAMEQGGLNMHEPHTIADPLAIEGIWKILISEWEQDSALSQESAGHALKLLLCLLRQSSDGTVSRAAEVPHYDKLTALRHEIYLHPEENWFIQDICDDIGISRPYFHKLYLAAFGTTCTQDVIASRIACAKRLLEETDQPIAVISQKCGFETDIYFMRQFKRHVGMTPTAYRRIYRQAVSKESL